MRKHFILISTILLISLPFHVANAADNLLLTTTNIPVIKSISPTNDTYFLNKKNSMVEKQYAILIQAKAKDGDKVAQKALADLYRDGRGVVKKDVVALMWYIISDKNGDKEANRDLSFTKSYMATDQIDQAQKLASKWLTLNQ